MPTISTGNPGWDQNLSTLGNALFPDPSKVGQGYYYGSQARKEQIEAAKIQDQMAAGHTALGMQFGRQPNPTYRTGAFDTTIMNDPGAGGAPMGGAPVATAPGPGGLGAMVANAARDPQAAATAIVAGFDNHSNTGAVPPASPATAVSGPQPNTTATDGSVPQNGPGNYHPASLNSAGGGGRVMAGAAAADGTPAPASFNFGQLAALMAQSGAAAPVIQAALQATAGNMVKNGQLPVPMAEEMGAFMGVPGMREQTLRNEGQIANTRLTEAGATTRTGMTIAGEMAREQLRTGETRRQFDFKPVVVVDPTTNQPVFTPQSQTTGKQAFEPSVATTIAGKENEPVLVDQGPGKPPITMTAKRAEAIGAPIYQQTLANTIAGQTSKIDTYINPNNPLEERTMSAGDAARNGWVKKPENENEMRGILDKAIVRETDPEKLQELQNKRNMIATAGKAATPEEQVQNQWITDTQFQKQFAVPGGYTGYGGGSNLVGYNTNPAATSPELGVTYADLTEQYFQRGPAGVRGNRVTASNEALKQLIEQGYVDPNQDRSQGMTSTSINANTYDKTGNITGQAPHFRVDIRDPDSKNVYPAGAPPKVVMRLSTAIPAPASGSAPAAPRPPGPTPNLAPSAPPLVLNRGAGVMPPGALAAAPGQPDGKTGTVGGTPTIVRGGFAYPR